MNRMVVVLPVASIVLGSLFLYVGFKSGANGYVTLSIDGAFLLLVGLISIFAPKAEGADVETLASLSKQVEGGGEHIPRILRGECSVLFTSDAKIALVGSKEERETIDPLSPQLRAKVSKALSQGRRGAGPYSLTSSYAKKLVELGVVSDFKLEAEEGSLVARLVSPVAGVPLFPEYDEPNRVDAIMLSSRLLATLASLISADVRCETVVRRVAKESEDLLFYMEVVGK